MENLCTGFIYMVGQNRNTMTYMYDTYDDFGKKVRTSIRKSFSVLPTMTELIPAIDAIMSYIVEEQIVEVYYECVSFSYMETVDQKNEVKHYISYTINERSEIDDSIIRANVRSSFELVDDRAFLMEHIHTVCDYISIYKLTTI